LKYIPIAVAMFVCSCATSGPPPFFEKTFDVRALDLAEYANEDFLITPNAYGGDYLTLAYITVDGGNAAVHVTVDQTNSVEYDGYFKRSYLAEWKQSEWKQEVVSLKEVIEAAVKAAKDMGANGLVNVQWHSDADIIPRGTTWTRLDRGKIYIEGWAIKRLAH
jgi:hypothetical protein